MLKTQSSKAIDRELAVWFQKIENGEIKLPRFQRFQAWDKNRIASLLETIVSNLPLGVTLLLEVGNEEKFKSRYLVTAPEPGTRVTEHLLDGQQRLTAFWRAMHNNYEHETYYVYIPQFDDTDDSIQSEEMFVHCQARWINKEGKRYPLWADSPYQALKRGLIPINLLCPGDLKTEIEEWINAAIEHLKPKDGDEDFSQKTKSYYEAKERINKNITEMRETVAHYNLPFLALPAVTPKETSLKVFINMNTNSKPLSLYDIIVAEVEGKKGESLHDLLNALDKRHPDIKYYHELPYLILATSALLQEKLPNQRGMLDMDKSQMVEIWDTMENGLNNMAIFLASEGIYDRQRIPTTAVMAVIAALYAEIPEKLDAKGTAEMLLKKYLWSSFFTDRYENSAATHAYYDFINLKRILTGATKNGSSYSENDVPVLNREKHKLADINELITVGWPKGENIRGRGIMAVATKLGALDFADGSRISREQLLQNKREYHHLFPDALLKEVEKEEDKEEEIKSFLALNCALISTSTNRNISRKDPWQYLAERYDWVDDDIVNERLNSHLIPVEELKNAQYEGMDIEEKKQRVKIDFDAFLLKRAELIYRAVEKLTSGRNISAKEIVQEPTEQPA